MEERNKVKYNDKIALIRAEINAEKSRLVGSSSAISEDVRRLLERRSPVDIGDLKNSWKVEVSGKHHLAGSSISKLSEVRPIELKINIKSSSRHASYQMFGFKAVPGQLLTVTRYNGKLRVKMASRPIFGKPSGRPRLVKPGKRKRVFNVVTRGGEHGPAKGLAITGRNSISSEIKRIVTRHTKGLKYLKVSDVQFTVTPAKKVVGRIQKWMEGSLSGELNSRATSKLRKE